MYVSTSSYSENSTFTILTLFLATQLEVEGRTAALYKEGSKHLFSANKPHTLRIYPEVLPIIEDIVTMLAYVTKRRDMSRQSRRRRAGSRASNAAVMPW